MGNGQEGWHFSSQQPHEDWVHVVVFVWYVEDDDSLVGELPSESGRKFLPVNLLHDEDDLGPLNQLGG